jgi:ankyrin repeat protein
METPLHLAATRFIHGTVRILLESGGNVNAKNSRGETPLVYAFRYREYDREVAATLIEHGADVNVCDTLGNTLLHHAAFHDDHATLLLCLGHGAFLNTKNREGNTPLCIAIKSGGETCVQTLVELGADIELPGPLDITPLQHAVYQENLRQSNTIKTMAFHRVKWESRLYTMAAGLIASGVDVKKSDRMETQRYIMRLE